MKTKSFLLIQTAFLGDVILSTPVVLELKRIFPEAAIDVLVRKGNEAFYANFPGVREVFVFDKKGGKFKELLRLRSELKKREYVEVINLQRFMSSGIISLFPKTKQRIGFKKNPLSFFYHKKIEHLIGNGQHEVERNLRCIAHHGAVEKRRPELFPTVDNFQKIEAFCTEEFYVLAPSSVWFTKQLPEKKWVDLLNLYSDKIVYLIGAGNDKKLCERILANAKHERAKHFCGQLSLMESVALISKAKSVFVNDSGPLHMASAMNIATNAFFCATIPKFGFGPLADNSKIHETKEDLTCRPCGLHGGKSCPKGHFNCGEIEISLENFV